MSVLNVASVENIPRTVSIWLLVPSSLAAPLLAPRLSRASIDSAFVPKGAPAFLGGTKGRPLDGWNPSMAANITDCHRHPFPAHA